MAYRALLEGGPLDGMTLHLAVLVAPDEEDPGWPTAIADSTGQAQGRYVLAETEPVPFGLGQHPHLLLTGKYRWEVA